MLVQIDITLGRKNMNLEISFETIFVLRKLAIRTPLNAAKGQG